MSKLIANVSWKGYNKNNYAARRHALREKSDGRSRSAPGGREGSGMTVRQYFAALQGKRVVVLGLGVSNLPLMQLLLD